MTNQEIAQQFIAENPQMLPANNPDLKRMVFDEHYQDRGLHGPYGGKNGALSQPWLNEHKRIQSGGPSELGLMTIIAPPEPPAKPQLSPTEQAQKDADDATYRAEIEESNRLGG